jgi:NADH-quinone oxidoreductase subunit J
MLTRRITDDELPAFNQSGRAAAMIAVLVFSGLALIMGSWSDFTSAQADEITRAGLVGEEVGQALIQELGQSLVSPDAYVIPFEVASVLLLAALIGSIVIARQSDKEAGR